MAKGFSYALNLEFLVGNDDEFILSITFEHADVLDISLYFKISLIKFKSRIDVSFLGKWVDFVNSVEILIIITTIFDPLHKHLWMKLLHSRSH